MRTVTSEEGKDGVNSDLDDKEFSCKKRDTGK